MATAVPEPCRFLACKGPAQQISKIIRAVNIAQGASAHRSWASPIPLLKLRTYHVLEGVQHDSVTAGRGYSDIRASDSQTSQTC